MKTMKEVYGMVLVSTNGKIGNENGIYYYDNVEEFKKITGHDDLENLSSWKDMNITDEFSGAFIAYDYLNIDFMFLTNTNDCSLFIERILAK